MATLKPIHDLTLIAGTKKEATRYSVDCVQYASESRRLIATDGRIAITVPVEGNHCDTALIEADKLAKAIGESSAVEMTSDGESVKIGRRKLTPRDGKFPNIDSVLTKHAHDTFLTLDVDVLIRLLAYAKRAKSETITLSLDRETGGKPKQIGLPVNFFLRAGSGEQIAGVVMPMEVGEGESLSKMVLETLGQSISPAEAQVVARNTNADEAKPVEKAGLAPKAKVAEPPTSKKAAATKAAPAKANGNHSLQEWLDRAELAMIRYEERGEDDAFKQVKASLKKANSMSPGTTETKTITALTKRLTAALMASYKKGRK